MDTLQCQISGGVGGGGVGPNSLGEGGVRSPTKVSSINILI